MTPWAVHLGRLNRLVCLGSRHRSVIDVDMGGDRFLPYGAPHIATALEPVRPHDGETLQHDSGCNSARLCFTWEASHGFVQTCSCNEQAHDCCRTCHAADYGRNGLRRRAVSAD